MPDEFEKFLEASKIIRKGPLARESELESATLMLRQVKKAQEAEHERWMRRGVTGDGGVVFSELVLTFYRLAKAYELTGRAEKHDATLKTLWHFISITESLNAGMLSPCAWFTQLAKGAENV
jgi:hypothetical protein